MGKKRAGKMVPAAPKVKKAKVTGRKTANAAQNKGPSQSVRTRVVKSQGFPSKSLVPKAGEIYCHIFENQRTGLARNLFWSITVEFEPIRYGQEEFDCSMTCDWIPWAVRDWRQLDGQQLDVDYGEDGIESSFYVTAHDLGTHTRLALRQRRANVFTVTMDMLVNFHGYYGGDAEPAMPVHAKVELPFLGLLVNPGSLAPKPNTPARLRKVAGEFVDLAAYEEPEPSTGGGFLFRPTDSK